MANASVRCSTVQLNAEEDAKSHHTSSGYLQMRSSICRFSRKPTFPELFQLSMWIEQHKVKPNGSDDVLSIVDGHIGCRLRVPRVEQKIEVISSQEGSQFHSGSD